MTKGHENKYFHFTFDNYYSNIYSFYYLYKNNIDFTCTFNQNKKGFPIITKIIFCIYIKIFTNTNIFIYFSKSFT